MGTRVEYLRVNVFPKILSRRKLAVEKDLVDSNWRAPLAYNRPQLAVAKIS